MAVAGGGGGHWIFQSHQLCLAHRGQPKKEMKEKRIIEGVGLGLKGAGLAQWREKGLGRLKGRREGPES